MAKQKKSIEMLPEERRAEFHAKAAILDGYYPKLAPLEFYSNYLFHDMDESEFKPSIILYEHGDEDAEHRWKRQSVEIDELMDYFHRNDVAVNPCGYWNNYPKKRLIRRVYAFAMDVDDVTAEILNYLLNLFENGKFPRPTVITNSGSGIHFFYILDESLQVGYREKYKQNLNLAEQIYFMLHKKMAEEYKGVQKHHIGQDYRVVGSLTKYGDITAAYETGDFWSVEALATAVGVNLKEVYKPLTAASPKMTAYARSIAQTLKLEMPDLSQPREVYDFIAEHKDAAYAERQRRREQSGKKNGKKTVGWYQDTWRRVYTKTEAGNRFNAMRGLAIVAFKCGIDEERFERDLENLSMLWQSQSWAGGDNFNPDNIEAIMRMFRNGKRYENTSRERLEELFGWKWNGKTNKKRKNPLSQKDHIKIMNTFRDIRYPNGEWRNKYGRPTAEQDIRAYMQEHPDARKCDVIRGTGRDKKTVYKYYDRIKQELTQI